MREENRRTQSSRGCTSVPAGAGDAQEGGAVLAPSVASGIAFLDRAFMLLRLLGEHGPTSAAHLVRISGMARPTVHRILSALTSLDLVAREGRGRYRLGLSLVGWGQAALASLGDWLDLAEERLAHLQHETGASVEMYVRESNWRVCALCMTGDRRPREPAPIGRLQPLTTGSSGRVLLAWSADAERFTNVDPQLLAAIRRRGWAHSPSAGSGEAELSVPILTEQGHPRAAICLTGLDPAQGIESTTALATRVAEAARDIEQLIARPQPSAP